VQYLERKPTIGVIGFHMKIIRLLLGKSKEGEAPSYNGSLYMALSSTTYSGMYSEVSKSTWSQQLLDEKVYKSRHAKNVLMFNKQTKKAGKHFITGVSALALLILILKATFSIYQIEIE
jgi:hypothetical protein